MSRTVLLGDPPKVVADWLKSRRALGQDGLDEMWEGDYHVAPAAHSNHGDVQAQLAVILGPLAKAHGLWLSAPVNIGVPDDYRVPDLVLLRERAGAMFIHSASIVVEVVFPGDESLHKLGFYFTRGVVEVLMVDPAAGSVDWSRRGASGFEPADASTLLRLSARSLAAEIDWPPLDGHPR